MADGPKEARVYRSNIDEGTNSKFRYFWLTGFCDYPEPWHEGTDNNDKYNSTTTEKKISYVTLVGHTSICILPLIQKAH